MAMPATSDVPSVADAPITDETRAGLRIAAVLAAALAVWVYSNSLRNGFVLDDATVVEANEAILHSLDLRTIFLTPSWFARRSATIVYRPLTTWTFAFDYAVHGLRPLGFHLVNVVLHAAASALVVVLAAAVGLPMLAAGLAGALFAVHPIHTEAVASVVGRAEILAALLALLALLAQHRARAAGWPLGVTAGAVGAYGLAVLAKENAVALAVVMPLADLLIGDQGSVLDFLRRLRGRRAALYAALVAVTGAYLLLRRTALGSLFGAGELGLSSVQQWQNPAAVVATPQRILTALRMQALALWLLVFPRDLSADYSYRQVQAIQSIGERGALVGLLVAGGLMALAIALWRRSPRALFWLLFSLATWGVVSNIAFPIGTIFGERLLYLPSVGFCALMALLLTRPTVGWMRAGAAALAITALVAGGVRTYHRNPVWADDLTLAHSMVDTAPDSVHAHRFLGTALSAEGRDDEALVEFARALAIDPKDTTSLYDTGVILQERDRAIDALTIFRKVLDIDPRYFPAWINFASVNSSQGMFTPALDAADRAIALRPDIPNGHIVRGYALRGLERPAEARAAFEEALRVAPDLPGALLGVAITAADLQDWNGAAKAFERLAAVAPSRDVYRSLVEVYRQAGRTADAERVAAEARGRFPDEPSFAP